MNCEIRSWLRVRSSNANLIKPDLIGVIELDSYEEGSNNADGAADRNQPASAGKFRVIASGGACNGTNCYVESSPNV